MKVSGHSRVGFLLFCITSIVTGNVIASSGSDSNGSGSGAGGLESAPGFQTSLSSSQIKSEIENSVTLFCTTLQIYEEALGSTPNMRDSEVEYISIITAINQVKAWLKVYPSCLGKEYAHNPGGCNLPAEFEYILRKVHFMINSISSLYDKIFLSKKRVQELGEHTKDFSKIPDQFFDAVNRFSAEAISAEDRKEKLQLAHEQGLAQVQSNEKVRLARLASSQTIAMDANSRAADAQVVQTQQRMQAVNKNLKLLLAGGSLATVGVLAAYFMFRKYAQPRPIIIEDGDTSIGTFFKKAKFPEPRLDSLVLTPELEHLVRGKFEALEIAILKKLPLSNMMFYGPPGTGKTMAAQEFLRYLSKLGIADHIIIRGPAFRRFSTTSQAIEALASLIRFVLSSYRKRKIPCLVFCDEADVLFANRLNPAISTDVSSNAVVTFSSLVPAAISTKSMWIFSGNNKEHFDPAIFDRVDLSNQIYFPLPGQVERESLLRLYLQKHLVHNGFALAPDLDSHIGELAQKLEGLSGRQISSTVAQSIYPLLNKGSGETELTVPIFESVIRDRVRAAG